MKLLSHKGGKSDPNQSEWKKRNEGFYLILKIIEKPQYIFGGIIIFLVLSKLLFNFLNISWGQLLLVIPILLLVFFVLVFVFIVKSYKHDKTHRNQKLESLLLFTSEKFKKKWKNNKKKIPIEKAIEAYMNGDLDFENDDVLEVFKWRYELFKFSFTFGHFKGFLKDIMGRIWKHGYKSDKKDVSEVYDRGNDFYGWFLDEHMIYSSGIFQNRNDTLREAQNRKLHKICRLLQMQSGKEHLDLGCGWGALINFASKYYGVKATGITLSSEQARFGREQAKKHRVENNTKVQVINFWDLPQTKKYDSISCLEMSEHIGIKKYQKFLRHVRNLLKDDGIFYLQIAGLRRAWQYEDLVWGLFMGKYVFPGADASCPFAWVAEQVERAGFEIRSMENNGVHYSLTIRKWYYNWLKNKVKVTKKYGEWWWRNWAVFLAWSYLIAAQGSSTVYMIALTKNLANDKSSRKIPENATEPVLDRTEMWITNQGKKSQRKK